jgi:hypothetical protein
MLKMFLIQIQMCFHCFAFQFFTLRIFALVFVSHFAPKGFGTCAACYSAMARSNRCYTLSLVHMIITRAMMVTSACNV